MSLTKLTAISSAHSTSSACSAAAIASSNPAAANTSAKRSWARATNPVDTAYVDALIRHRR